MSSERVKTSGSRDVTSERVKTSGSRDVSSERVKGAHLTCNITLCQAYKGP